MRVRFLRTLMFGLVAAAVVASSAVGVAQQPPAQATAPQPSGTGAITGQVVAADNGTPVKRARVMLVGMLRPPTPSSAPDGAAPVAIATVVTTAIVPQGTVPTGSSLGGSSRFERDTESDAGGRFEFHDLPSGEYFASVMPSAGFVAPRSMDTIRVDDGKTATVTIKLERAGAITGRVLDGDGEPVTNAMVRVMKWDSMGGVRRLSQRGGASTNDLGEFRVFALPSGEYYVGAAIPNYRSRQDVPGPATGFVTTYYPSVTLPAESTPVAVRAGSDTGGIEIHLLTAPLATITGTVSNADGQPLSPAGRVNLTLISQADEQAVPTANVVRPDGTFTLSGVGPGDYYLAATVFPTTPGTPTAGPPTTRPGVFTTVSVNGSNLTVNLELNDGATIAGRVRIDDAQARSEAVDPPAGQATRWTSGLGSTRISTRLEYAGSLSMISAQGSRPVITEDGTFTITGLRGRVSFFASGPGMLKAVMLGGRDVTGTPIELAGQERLDGLELVLTTEVGRILGRVLDASGEPALRTLVIAIPDDPARLFPNSPFVRNAGTLDRAADLTGARQGMDVPTLGTGATAPGDFVMTMVLPGRYRLVAFDRSSSPTGMPDVETLRAMASRGTAVTVEAGKNASVELRPTTLPGRK